MRSEKHVRRIKQINYASAPFLSLDMAGGTFDCYRESRDCVERLFLLVDGRMDGWGYLLNAGCF